MSALDTLSTLGVEAFGSSMPVLAPTWTTAMPTADGMALTLSGGDTWLSPLAAYRRTPAEVAERSGVLLRVGTGAKVPDAASVLSLYPQQYLRLARLYALLLEDAAAANVRPERAVGLPARPVPAHIVLGDGGVTDAGIDAGDTLVAGTLSFHDHLGQPIDALAVASAFLAILTAHPTLQASGTAGLQAMLAALAPAPAAVRVRFVDATGMTASAQRLTNLTSVTPSEALHTVPAGATIDKDPVANPPDPAYTSEDRRMLVVGLATSGRLGDSVTFPALPSGVTLARDFFTLRLLQLGPTLIGTPATGWKGARIEPRPAVRINEPLTFLPTGNDVLGAAAEALTGATLTESIAVAQQIDGAFAAPATAGAAAHWPQFPPLGTVTAAPAGAVPIAMRDALSPAAAYFSDGDPATTDLDVLLTLNSLPAGATVRAYHRVFSAEAVESRGDGAGGVADAAGTVRLLLRDPLGLHHRGLPPPSSVPADALLHVDVVVVKRSGEARIFGDVTVPIAAAATAALPATTNPFGTAARRGICQAGLLGLGSAPTPPVTAKPVETLLALLSEGNPRDAPRLPGMARRELVVAGLAAPTGGVWKSVLSAGRLAPELHNASPRLGAPGGQGGRETQVVGVATAGGRLAYDLARAGLRRTTNIVPRMVPLASSAWDEPPAATAGTFAGAVLQTIAAGCETPELALLRTFNIFDPETEPIPRNFDQLIDKAKVWLTALVGQLPAVLPEAAKTKATELLGKLDGLKDNAPADQNMKERLFDELYREAVASGWGRRDAQWALQDGLGRAQRFVYIETPGVSATAAPGAADPFAADVFQALATRLSSTPSLHAVICCPREPDYPFGFNPFRDLEAKSRNLTVLGLPTATVADPVGSRVVAFHPIGFPGRPSRLESTTVIVDDNWALIGASTLRRRGVSFDGATDLVCTDLALREGRSPAIAGLRRTLQAARLGIAAPAVPSALPSSSWVRLDDGVEAFHQIREFLRAGGMGRIERLASPDPVGRPAAPGPIDAVDPDGETLDLPQLLALLLLAGAASA